MIERVVENWLDSINERGYENALCQALVAAGHTIIRRPAHGPTEHGKDIVTRDRDSHYQAFQLKTGDINKSEWRKIRGEVEELITVPIQEPSVPARSNFIPHLVTNGEITGPVKDEIRARIAGSHKSIWRKLKFITRDDLLRMFLDLHGGVLPFGPSDFERFLRLYLADKRAFINKSEFSEFLVSLVPKTGSNKSAQVKRTIAGIAVLANYILSGYGKTRNHLAVAEGWVLVFSHLLRVAEVARANENSWRASIQICLDEWEVAIADLAKEAMASPNWIEGDISVDNFVHGHRKVLLIGYLATFALYRRLVNHPLENEDEIFVRVSAEIPPIRLWGESALPALVAVILFLWKRGQEGEAVALCHRLIKVIAITNGLRDGAGLPDPYFDGPTVLQWEISAKRALGIMQFVQARDRSMNAPARPEYYQSLVAMAQNASGAGARDVWQTFAGTSFGIRCLVEFLARRERKQALKSLWYDITRVDYAEFVPSKATDFYLWHVDDGTLVMRRFRRPETWENLFRESNTGRGYRISLFTKYPQLLLPFALVYPHRFTPDVLFRWEKMLKRLP